MCAKIGILVAILTAMQYIGVAQEAEVGIRFNADLLFLRRYEVTGLEEGSNEFNPLAVHLSGGLRISDNFISELRAGYSFVGSFDGAELGLLLKWEITPKTYYIAIGDWLHWNRGGSGGITTNTYEKLFNAAGVGVGLHTGTHSSMELMFLRPFDVDLGYTWYYPPDTEKKKPTRLVGIVRISFGFSWGI